MHLESFLAIEELIHAVIIHLDRSALANLARSSRMFHEPAVRELWRVLPFLNPLLTLFPEEIVSSKDGLYLVCFTWSFPSIQLTAIIRPVTQPLCLDIGVASFTIPSMSWICHTRNRTDTRRVSDEAPGHSTSCTLPALNDSQFTDQYSISCLACDVCIGQQRHHKASFYLPCSWAPCWRLWNFLALK